MSQVKVTFFDYCPGDKWSCGKLNFDADTPYGKFTWREVVPGPRHSDDSRQLTVTLNGQDITDSLGEQLPDLDFEPPGKQGKCSERFDETGQQEVQDELDAWIGWYKEEMEQAV